MKQQTAVEWLAKELEKYGNPTVCEILWEDFDSLIERAKQMEKEQTEIPNEEIEREASKMKGFKVSAIAFEQGAKWYREQLKSKQ